MGIFEKKYTKKHVFFFCFFFFWGGGVAKFTFSAKMRHMENCFFFFEYNIKKEEFIRSGLSLT